MARGGGSQLPQKKRPSSKTVQQQQQQQLNDIVWEYIQSCIYCCKWCICIVSGYGGRTVL